MNLSTSNLPCFLPEEANKLVGFQGKILSGVTQFFWENRAKTGEHITLRMELVFHFSDGTELPFYAHEERSGLVMGKLDKKLEQLKINELAQPGIRLRGAIEDENADWEPFLGETLVAIELTAFGKGAYQNDQMLFDFGFTKVLISRPLDGIEVEELVNEDEV